MRLKAGSKWSALIVLGALVGASSAGAIVPVSPWDGYWAELNRQCPDKQLVQLDQNDLRVALRSFRATLSQEEQASVTDAIASDCSSSPYPHTAMCDNTATIDAITRQGHLALAVSRICAAYACDNQSNCHVSD